MSRNLSAKPKSFERYAPPATANRNRRVLRKAKGRRCPEEAPYRKEQTGRLRIRNPGESTVRRLAQRDVLSTPRGRPPVSSACRRKTGSIPVARTDRHRAP